MLYCSNCQSEKPDREFYKSPKTKNCRDCERAYRRERYHNTKVLKSFDSLLARALEVPFLSDEEMLEIEKELERVKEIEADCTDCETVVIVKSLTKPRKIFCESCLNCRIQSILDQRDSSLEYEEFHHGGAY